MFCSEVEGGLSSEQANKRLRLFVPAAAELSRQRESTQLGPKHQLSMVRAALRLGRQVPAPCPLPLPPAFPSSSALCCCLVPPHSQIPNSTLKAHFPDSEAKSHNSLFVRCFDSILIGRHIRSSDAAADDVEALAIC